MTIGGDNWTVHHGDCVAVLRAMPERSVHCIVSSPPYWGLRDYGIAPVEWTGGYVYGCEPTPQLYVANTVKLFAAMGRVLRDDGVIWWNVGDTYSNSPGKRKVGDSVGEKQSSNGGSVTQGSAHAPGAVNGTKLLIPHRVAIALQDAGWVIRQDNVWRKASPMPESLSGWRWVRCRVKAEKSKRAVDDTRHANGSLTPQAGRDGKAFDSQSKWLPCPGCPKCEPNGGCVLRRGAHRTTNAHEYLFQITKSSRYCGFGEQVAEQAAGDKPGNKDAGKYEHQGGSIGRRSVGKTAMGNPVETRNPRSCLTFPTEPFKGKHFAAFPSTLPFFCIKSSTSDAGCCPACGDQYAPIVRTERVPTRPGHDTKVDGHSAEEIGNRDPQRHIQRTIVEGYRATCDCKSGEPIPCTVLEPFSGSGTTIQVAVHTGRRAIGFEVAAHYLPLIEERVKTVPKCCQKKGPAKAKKRKRHRLQMEMFG